MQSSANMRMLDLLRYLYQQAGETHSAAVSDIMAHLNGKGIQAARRTVMWIPTP